MGFLDSGGVVQAFMGGDNNFVHNIMSDCFMLESYINKIIKFAFKAFKAKKHTDLLPLSLSTEI